MMLWYCAVAYDTGGAVGVLSVPIVIISIIISYRLSSLSASKGRKKLIMMMMMMIERTKSIKWLSSSRANTRMAMRITRTALVVVVVVRDERPSRGHGGPQKEKVSCDGTLPKRKRTQILGLFCRLMWYVESGVSARSQADKQMQDNYTWKAASSIPSRNP